jgi:GntR family transcriptional regulator, arabinose operon transcriptional repressor
MAVQHVLTNKYQQIVNWIKTEVQAGSILPGDKLPSESELCSRFAVSRSAVRQALTTMVHEGWLESRKGIGTFCTAKRNPRSGELAFVSFFAASYIFPGIITAFERTAGRNGYHMIFNQSESDLEKERSILRKLKQKGVDGVAIVPINAGLDEPGSPTDLGATNYGLLGELMDSGTLVVLIDNNFGDERFPSIALDDAAAGRMAARYLYGKGHRDIGIAYARNHRPFKLRKEGFSEALSAFGLAPSAFDVGVDRTADAEEALYDAFGGSPGAAFGAHRPSAYFCANDEIAVALYKAAARRGLSIPRDLSVISVDNSDYAQLPSIDLTSISHPSAFIGVKAAQILIDGIADPDVRFKQTIAIEPVVIERSSVRTLG